MACDARRASSMLPVRRLREDLFLQPENRNVHSHHHVQNLNSDGHGLFHGVFHNPAPLISMLTHCVFVGQCRWALGSTLKLGVRGRSGLERQLSLSLAPSCIIPHHARMSRRIRSATLTHMRLSTPSKAMERSSSRISNTRTQRRI